jgi:predicted secreted protein
MAEQSGADPKDGERIDISNDEDIGRWAKALATTGVKIIDAVEKVGPNVSDVRQHFNQQIAGGQADA